MSGGFGHHEVPSSEVTVIYDDAVWKAREVLSNEGDLWLTLTALTQIPRFVLKPEGVCLDDLCIPIPQARENVLLRQHGGKMYFNLSELARVLHQPQVHDAVRAIWLFGDRPDARIKLLDTLEAPHFTLPDWRGRFRSLVDFRGSKVLLITWASW